MKALSTSQSIFIPARALMGNLKKRPWILSFEVTLSCVAMCQHCDTGGYRDNEQKMSPTEYRKYISKLKPAVIQLSGGEPLLRDDLAEIIRQIKNGTSMPYIIVVTNGHLLNEERYEELKEAGADRFSLSLDFPNEKHDEFRRIPGLYKHLEELVPKLASFGNNDIAMNCCITLPNVSYIEAAAEKCNEWGVAISYSAYSKKRIGDPKFFISKESDLDILKKGIENLIKMKRQGIKIMNSDSVLRNFYNFFKNDGFTNCSAGKTFLVVRPEGKMNPCSMFREKRYTDQRVMLKEFSEHNDCKDCYVGIRAYSDKSIWSLLWDAMDIVKW
jgi:MoaA/NifB/PqqE/SkfB family radical SAM enzyme